MYGNEVHSLFNIIRINHILEISKSDIGLLHFNILFTEMCVCYEIRLTIDIDLQQAIQSVYTCVYTFV